MGKLLHLCDKLNEFIARVFYKMRRIFKVLESTQLLRQKNKILNKNGYSVFQLLSKNLFN
jgi:hypothetical protein